MSVKVALTAFVSVFLAELADKTQLATFALASESRSRWAVFVGAATALVCSSALAVLLGDSVARIVPEMWLKRGAAASFLLIGGWMLWRAGNS